MTWLVSNGEMHSNKNYNNNNRVIHFRRLGYKHILARSHELTIFRTRRTPHLVVLREQHMDVLEETDTRSAMNDVVGAFLNLPDVLRLHGTVLTVHISLHRHQLLPQVREQFSVRASQQIEQLLAEQLIKTLLPCMPETDMLSKSEQQIDWHVFCARAEGVG
jgi:hypothetical protein